MFSKNSRYKELKDIVLKDSNSLERKSKSFRHIPPTEGVVKHQVTEADRLDLLAFKYYKDSQQWWKICDANPEFLFPDSLLNEEPFVVYDLYLDKTKADLNNLSKAVNLLLKSSGIEKVSVDRFNKGESYFEVNADGTKTEIRTYQPKIQIIYNGNDTDLYTIKKQMESVQIIVSEENKITLAGREINIPAK